MRQLLIAAIALLLFSCGSKSIKEPDVSETGELQITSGKSMSFVYVSDGESSISMNVDDSSIAIRGDTTAILKVLLNKARERIVMIAGADTIQYYRGDTIRFDYCNK